MKQNSGITPVYREYFTTAYTYIINISNSHKIVPYSSNPTFSGKTKVIRQTNDSFNHTLAYLFIFLFTFPNPISLLKTFFGKT